MKAPTARRLPSGNWNVQIMVNGKRVSITKPTKQEAERAAAAHKIRTASPDNAEEKTLGALIDEYIEAKTPTLSPVSIRDYKGTRTHRFAPYMDVRYKDIRSWQKLISDEIKRVSAQSVIIGWRLLIMAFKYADLPVPRVDLPKLQRTKKPYLTAEEIPAFLDAIRGDPYELRMLFCLHGMRSSEACGIRWEDIDLKRKTIRVSGTLYRTEENTWIRKESTKTASSSRTVPFLIPRMEELLKGYDRKQPLPEATPPTIYNRVNAACYRAGLPRIGSHGLRRSFASLAYHLGVPERIAMQLGGWSSIRTMHNIYIQIAETDIEHYGAEIRAFFDP